MPKIQNSQFTIKIALLLDAIGRDEAFSEHGFLVSGRLSRFRNWHLI
jgi:hypothetical protein